MENNYRLIVKNYIENLKVLETFINGLDDMISYQLNKYKAENLTDKNLVPIFKAFSVLNEDIDKDLKEKKIMELNEEFPHGIISFKSDLEYDEENGSGISLQIKDSQVAKDFAKTTDHLELSAKQIPMILTSSLINLAVYFELLTTKLIQERLIAHPEAMNIKQKSLTLFQIEEIGSLEEAKNFLIEQEVVDLMHNGFKIWMEYFEKKMKVDLRSIKNDFEQVNEVFCRRHLFIHNGGVVNNIYLTRVSREFHNGIKQGDSLEVSRDYFLKSVNLFKTFGIILGLETWKKHDKVSEDRVEFLLEYIYELLLEGRWEIASIICNFLLNDNQVPSKDKWIAQINYWLTQKRLGKYEDIKQDIDKADLSALNDVFQVCKYALLEKHDEICYLLQNVYPNSIDLNDLQEWPILEEFRQSQQYNDFITEVLPKLNKDLVTIE